jgi:hypothetical protein
MVVLYPGAREPVQCGGGMDRADVDPGRVICFEVMMGSSICYSSR